MTADDVRKTSAGSPAEVVTSLLYLRSGVRSADAAFFVSHRRNARHVGEATGSRAEITRHSLSPIFAGRDRTLWWLKSHIGILHLLPGCTPESTKGPPPLNDIRQAGAKRKNRTYGSRRWRVTSSLTLSMM